MELIKIKDMIMLKKFKTAKQLLGGCISEDVENPIFYNLLGIIYEMQGDRQHASKLYRVAYYLNQSFDPARKNLERCTSFNYQNDGVEIDFGI